MGSIPDKTYFFSLRIDPNFTCDSERRKQRHVYKWYSRKTAYKPDFYINPVLLSHAHFPRILFIYMALLSHLAITCKFWVNSERKKFKFYRESNPRPKISNQLSDIMVLLFTVKRLQTF